ncbi:chromate resistance protein [Candidatus Poribacteria bacterium]|nr:chromate resistance protein [Candidatus Poribacteria bacterium]
MKWVTRENANVDRIACPWLIKRFIDKEAEFLFVPRDKVLKTIAFGFALTVKDDHRKIELETPMYDGLYEWCKCELGK